MKYISIILAVVSIVLTVWLFNSLTTQQDLARQHDEDAKQVGDFSNQLVSAQAEVINCDNALLVLSNRMDESRLALSSLSNQLDAAQASLATEHEQVVNLTRDVADKDLQNEQLTGSIGELTNQVAGLVGQVLAANTNLARMAQEYSLLENRLRRDVAERVVVERNFSNYAILQMQVQKLMTNGPTPAVTPRDIYAGLNVEVDENGEAHVISPTVPPDTDRKL